MTILKGIIYIAKFKSEWPFVLEFYVLRQYRYELLYLLIFQDLQKYYFKKLQRNDHISKDLN